MNHFPSIVPARTALVVIDMQNAFIAPGEVFANPHAADIVTPINRLATSLRATGGWVVWTRQTIADEAPLAPPAWHYDRTDPWVGRAVEALRDGAASHDIHPDLAVAATDLLLNKYRYSAFLPGASDIDAQLAGRAIDTVIVAGTLTNVCCDSSARDAYMLGYKVLFASDATAALTDEEHNAALLTVCLNFADLRDTDELLAMIAAAAD